MSVKTISSVVCLVAMATENELYRLRWKLLVILFIFAKWIEINCSFFLDFNLVFISQFHGNITIMLHFTPDKKKHRIQFIKLKWENNLSETQRLNWQHEDGYRQLHSDLLHKYPTFTSRLKYWSDAENWTKTMPSYWWCCLK